MSRPAPKSLGTFAMTDQPETCPQCGRRAELDTEQRHGAKVIQACYCAPCNVTWFVEGAA